jgi:hypothetical protein
MPTDRPPKQEAIDAGQRLRRLRIALGFPTQKLFAPLVGLDKDTFGAYERGQNLVPQYIVTRLKRQFGVTHDYVYEGDHRGLPFELAMKLTAMDEQET